MSESTWRSSGAIAVMHGLLGCSSSHSAPLPPSPSTTASALTTAAKPPAKPIPPASASPDPEAELAKAVAAARACTSPRIEIAPLPAEAKVFNNALTRKDAGNVDRMQGIVEALFAATNEFACCIDAGTQGLVEADVTVFVRLQVSPEGLPSRVQTVPERSSVGDAVVDACLAAVVGEMKFPASPAGKATTVEVPLKGRTVADETNPVGDEAN